MITIDTAPTAARSAARPPTVQAALPTDRPLAVVIGISNYARASWNLRTAASDAAALADLLQTRHGYDVIVRCNHEASHDGLRQLLGAELRAAMAGRRRLVVYFAGHGIAEDTVGDIAGYLVPHDGNDDLGSLLSMREVAAALRALDCHHLFVILECCFAGSFNWAATRDVGRLPCCTRSASSCTWHRRPGRC
jgi:hypothetical protein